MKRLLALFCVGDAGIADGDFQVRSLIFVLYTPIFVLSIDYT